MLRWHWNCLGVNMPLKLTDKQKQGLAILNNPEKSRILFTGGSRSGKTVLLFEWFVQRAFQYPGIRQLICRRALVDCRRAMWDDTMPKYLNAFIPKSEWDMQKSELKVIFRNGSEITLGGLDDDGSLDKILGTEYGTVFINECTELKFEAVQRLITRLAQRVQDPNTGNYVIPKLVADCNPTTPRSWVKRYFLDLVDPTTRPAEPLKDKDKFDSLHWTPYDNKENLPPGYIEQLDALPYEMRERMLNGNWVGGEGLIFKDFRIDKHVIEPFTIPVQWEKVRAIDFGYDHPCGILYSAYDYVTDTIYIYDEYKESGKTIDEIGDYLNKKERERHEYYSCTWADHDKSDRAFLFKHGITTRAAKKSVLDGISSVNQRLSTSIKTGKPRLLVFKNCNSLIDEIFSYEWHKSNSEITDKDAPIKINDDLVDPLRYICYGRDKESGSLY